MKESPRFSIHWKRIVKNIHRAPLDHKESNRLRNSITDSFRKHLDQAHPPANADPNDGKPGSRGVPPIDPTSFQSSAAHAQRHLASILTNPLLARPGADLTLSAARARLWRGSPDDPLELLEEFESRGCRSSEIAQLCMLHALYLYLHMKPDQQQQYLLAKQPGKRAARWLFNGRWQDHFPYPHLINPIVYFLMQENSDQVLWAWLQTDAIVNPPFPELSSDVPEAHDRHSCWRAHLLVAMVRAKTGPRLPLGTQRLSYPITLTGIRAGIDILHRACALSIAADPSHPISYYAGLYLVQLICRSKPSIYNTKPMSYAEELGTVHYDRLRACANNILAQVPSTMTNQMLAKLDLFHPIRRTHAPAYALLQVLLDTRTRSQEQVHFLSLISESPAAAAKELLSTTEARAWAFGFIIDTMRALREHGDEHGVSRLESQIQHVITPFDVRCLHRVLGEFGMEDVLASRESRPDNVPQSDEEAHLRSLIGV
jgi:hypothetical protein